MSRFDAWLARTFPWEMCDSPDGSIQDATVARREGAEFICEVKPGDTVHACACGNHVFTLPSLRFIRTARDGKSYVITPTLPSPR